MEGTKRKPEGGGEVGEVEVGGGSGSAVKLLFIKLQITSKQLVIHSDHSIKNKARNRKENLIGVKSEKEPFTGISPVSRLFEISLHFRMIPFVRDQDCTKKY